MQLNPGELPLLQQMVRQLTGVALDGSKGYLVESRLGPIAEQMGCANFNELYFRVRYGRDAALEAMVWWRGRRALEPGAALPRVRGSSVDRWPPRTYRALVHVGLSTPVAARHRGMP